MAQGYNPELEYIVVRGNVITPANLDGTRYMSKEDMEMSKYYYYGNKAYPYANQKMTKAELVEAVKTLQTQVAAINAAGYITLEDVPVELPEAKQADAGKVLTVVSDGEGGYEWDAAAVPTQL